METIKKYQNNKNKGQGSPATHKQTTTAMKIKIEHKEEYHHELEPFSTVGTIIDTNWKIEPLSEDQLNDLRFRLKKTSDFMFEQFDEMEKDYPDTNLEFLYEELEEIHAEMGETLLIHRWASFPQEFNTKNL